MIDLTYLTERKVTFAKLVAGLTPGDLRDLTNQMIDRQLALIAGCSAAAVVFIPDDPAADDPFAATPEETKLSWTLGHVIVHVTATSEETAFIAAEMARGVVREGRSRYETPWETVTTIAQCRERLAESRRLRLATLDVWPNPPHLDVTIPYRRLPEPVNAVGRFVMGLVHDVDHLGQIESIVGQAEALGLAEPR
jgi:hypothetical protein